LAHLCILPSACTVRWMNRRGLKGTIVGHRLCADALRVASAGRFGEPNALPQGSVGGTRPAGGHSARRGTRPAAQMSAARFSRRHGPPTCRKRRRIQRSVLPWVVPDWMRSHRAMRIKTLLRASLRGPAPARTGTGPLSLPTMSASDRRSLSPICRTGSRFGKHRQRPPPLIARLHRYVDIVQTSWHMIWTPTRLRPKSVRRGS
jgi:hypothetical protein